MKVLLVIILIVTLGFTGYLAYQASDTATEAKKTSEVAVNNSNAAISTSNYAAAKADQADVKADRAIAIAERADAKADNGLAMVSIVSMHSQNTLIIVFAVVFGGLTAIYFFKVAPAIEARKTAELEYRRQLSAQINAQMLPYPVDMQPTFVDGEIIAPSPLHLPARRAQLPAIRVGQGE